MEPMTKQQRHECLWSNYQTNSRLDLWIKEYFDVLLLFFDWLVVSLLIIVFCCWYLSVYQMLPWNVLKRLRTDRKKKTKHPGITFRWIWWRWNHHKLSDTINVHWMTCCEAKGLLPTFISISVAQGWLKHRKESKLWLGHGVGYCSCENISKFSQLGGNWKSWIFKICQGWIVWSAFPQSYKTKNPIRSPLTEPTHDSIALPLQNSVLRHPKKPPKWCSFCREKANDSLNCRWCWWSMRISKVLSKLVGVVYCFIVGLN